MSEVSIRIGSIDSFWLDTTLTVNLLLASNDIIIVYLRCCWNGGHSDDKPEEILRYSLRMVKFEPRFWDMSCTDLECTRYVRPRKWDYSCKWIISDFSMIERMEIRNECCLIDLSLILLRFEVSGKISLSIKFRPQCRTRRMMLLP